MLWRGIVLAWLVLAAPLADAAATSDPSLAAAVAPIQTVFDGAAREIQLAITESARDGTPDAALALHAQLVAFVAGLEENRTIAPSASHREEALAAMPSALRVAATLGNVTEDIARLSTSGETCAHRSLGAEELADLQTSLSLVRATGTALARLAQDAPTGVDGRALQDAAERLSGWDATFEGFVGCHVGDQGQPPRPFLRLEVVPAVGWPTRAVEVRGASSLAGPVRITAAALGWDANVTLGANGSFQTRFVIPRAARDGNVTVRALAGPRVAFANLTVVRAPSTLAVTGPVRGLVGGNVTLGLRLESPLASEVAHARIRVDGGGRSDVVLEGGAAELRIALPREPGLVEVAFHFPGTSLVAGADARYQVRVGAEPVPVQGASQPAQAQDPLSAFALLTVFLLLFVAACVALAVARARSPPRPSSDAPAGSPSVPSRARRPATRAAAALLPRTLVDAFSGVVRALRAARLVPASMTAREMRPTLARLGFELDDLVPAFEASRYGGRPEPAGWSARLAGWTERAWRRLREVAP